MPTPHAPFMYVLVPYDGSGPARAALTLAIALATHGAILTVVTIVDEATAIAQSASAMTAYDPMPLMDALDDQGLALLYEAVAQCRTAKVVPGVDMVHDTPAVEILSAVVRHVGDLVIMGTPPSVVLPRNVRATPLRAWGDGPTRTGCACESGNDRATTPSAPRANP